MGIDEAVAICKTGKKCRHQCYSNLEYIWWDKWAEVIRFEDTTVMDVDTYRKSSFYSQGWIEIN